MRLSASITTIVIASAFAVSPVSAQGHAVHGKLTTSPAKAPHSTTKPTTHTSAKATSKPTAHANTHTSSTHTHAKPKTSTTTTTASSTTTRKTSTTTSGSTTATATMNPIATKIASHPQLKAKVMAMVPSGMTLDQASTGFRNQGQFIAALHAADHMGCNTCFAQLKADMVDKGMSLGQSIQDVRHTTSTTAQTQAAAAQREADSDLKVTTTTTTTTSSQTSTSTSTSRKKPHGGDE